MASLSAALVGMLACSAAAAADPAPAASATPTIAAASAGPSGLAAFDQAIAARRVAEFARRQKDPQAMIVAARMLQEVPFRDAGGEGGAAAFTPDALFDEAKVLARGDQATLMQINVARSTGSRGVLSSAFGAGLVRLVREVGARAAYSFAIRVKGGEPLRIGAIGDIGTAMVLRLVELRGGKLACADANGDYAPVCAVRPGAATDYRVELLNQSATATRAVILSN